MVTITSDMYKASIVVPVLSQRDEWLRQCVLSAVHQTVTCEVILVTSPNTPESNRLLLEELRNSYNNISVLTQPPNTGYARAFNVGIKHACTPRVGFLLSDDWLSELAVSACLQFQTDIVSTGLVVYDASGVKTVATRRQDMAEFLALPTLESKASYLKHFLLFNKQRLLEIGGVDETIGRTGPDDYDLVWTLLEHGATVEVTRFPFYNYRDHFGQRLTLRMRKDQVRDLVKILDKHNIYGDERKAVIAQHSKWYGMPIQVAMKRQAKSEQ